MGPSLAILLPATAIAALAFVWIVRRELLRRDILDRPNERSSHATPTPRGGGIGLLAALLPAWLIAAFLLTPATTGPQAWLLPLCALLLAAVSWIDDLRTIGPLPRLAAQFATAIAGVLILPGLVFQGLLPPWLDAALAAVGLVWFVNLFNFMDGIDGISAVEAIAIGLGLGAIGLWLGAAPGGNAVPALLIAAASAGFLAWNWHPAKIFLGDIGSVPLGFLLGWLLLALAAGGHWEAALILPLYYLADATLTLLRRLARGEKVWRAHREHFYQQAVQNGRSHARVSAAVAVANAALIGLALGAAAAPDSLAVRLGALALAAAVVVALLAWMRRPGPAAGQAPG
ncbi:MAG: glycosyltransferase family 4 protein [Alphaproteobacteria bacterium]|nr:glycosyltransferase family 4 protein [Alphaproteobacteria bacterium]